MLAVTGINRKLVAMPSEFLSFPDRYRQTDAEVKVEHCPNCDGPTKLRRNDRRVVWPRITPNLAPAFTRYVVEEVWSCVVCDMSMIQLLIYGASDKQERDPEEVRVVFPDRAPRSLPAEAPDSMASLFREASIAENAGAMRGAAALYRAAVEDLVKDQGSTHGKLEEKIEGLRSRGVDDQVVSDLHEARLLGNWSLHDGIEFGPDEVADVAELIQAAVHELYVELAQRAAMRQARAARRTRPSSELTP
jgi:hypothetical protein